jgi:hypothetical protein
MKFPKNIWDQIKSLTSNDFYQALQKDDKWEFIDSKGAQQTFRNKCNGDYVSIHLHPTSKCGYGQKLLKDLLDQIGWSEEEMRQLKLIK